MRRWYVVFRDGVDQVLGLTGPYVDKTAAEAAYDAIMRWSAASVNGLDLDAVPPGAQCIFSPFDRIGLVDLSPAEVETLR